VEYQYLDRGLVIYLVNSKWNICSRRTRLTCTYILDTPKFRLSSLVSVRCGLEEDEIFVDFLFRRFHTCLYCLLLYLTFVHRGTLYFVVLRYQYNPENWNATNKNELTIDVRKRKWANVLFFSLEMPVPSQGHCSFPCFPFRQILSVCWLMSFAFSFWKIARCSVILLLPLYIKGVSRIHISKKNRQHNGQKKKVLKDKQRSTKHTHKTKDRVKRTPLNTGGELMCSGRVSSSCFISSTRRVNLIAN
jgi:hypothetical protein